VAKRVSAALPVDGRRSRPSSAMFSSPRTSSTASPMSSRRARSRLLTPASREENAMEGEPSAHSQTLSAASHSFSRT